LRRRFFPKAEKGLLENEILSTRPGHGGRTWKESNWLGDVLPGGNSKVESPAKRPHQEPNQNPKSRGDKISLSNKLSHTTGRGIFGRG